MKNSEKAPVSVAIVARDEADRIAGCIDSIGFADEVVVVVDERSRDDTLAIAQAKGCRALSNPWKGFAEQKQFAVNACSNDWVLILDADERLPDDTAKRITRLLAGPRTAVCAYALYRKNIFHGRWVKRCGWWPDRVVRLVDRKRGRFSDHRVHEHWVADGEVDDLGTVIEHHSFRNYADLIDKMQNYSTLAAMQMQASGRTVRWWTPVSHGAWMFVRTYLLELGILEGFDGLVISILNAGGSFLKYAKLREATIRDADHA